MYLATKPGFLMSIRNIVKTDINSNKFTGSNQLSSIKFANDIRTYNVCQPEEFINIIKYFKPIQLRVLGQVLYNFSRYATVYASQKYMASHARMCRQSFNEGLGVLKSLGVVTVTNRGVKKTCTYTINKLFYAPEVQGKLSGLLPILSKSIFYLQGLWEKLALVQRFKKPATQDSLINILNVYLEDQGTLSLSHKRVPGRVDRRTYRDFIPKGRKEEKRYAQIRAICEYVSKHVTFSLHAVVKLMVFDSGILEMAFDRLRKIDRHIQRPFGIVHGHCWFVYEHDNEPIESAFYFKLLTRYGLNKKDPVIL